MKLISQFKSALLFKTNLETIYKKLYKFNRKKWQNLKKVIVLKKKQKYSIPFSKVVNSFALKISFKKWNKLKMYYKSSLMEKRKLNLNYANSLRLRNLKTLVNNTSTKYNRFSIYKNLIIRLEYRLDIFLYKLKLFPNLFQARSEIQKGNIYVNNNKIVKYNYTLQKGDIVSFSDTLNFDLQNMSRKTLHRSRLLSIIEFDIYNKNIIILKNFSELTQEDFFSFNLSYINLNYLLFYLKKN
jgi:ribosomal protein S4